MFKTAIGQTRRPWRRRVVLSLGHFDFDIVSDFDIRISDFTTSVVKIHLTSNSLSDIIYT